MSSEKQEGSALIERKAMVRFKLFNTPSAPTIEAAAAWMDQALDRLQALEAENERLRGERDEALNDNRLELEALGLRERSEAAEAKASTAEAEIARLTRERDYAWSEMQNAQAYWRVETSHAAQAEARASTLSASLARAVEVLEPFARAWRETFGADDPASWPPGLDTAPAVNSPCVQCLTLEQFQAAADFLAQLEESGDA